MAKKISDADAFDYANKLYAKDIGNKHLGKITILLEKQVIAKKPITEETNDSSIGKCYCPNCNHIFFYDHAIKTHRIRYCEECGQRLGVE